MLATDRPCRRRLTWICAYLVVLGTVLVIYQNIRFGNNSLALPFELSNMTYLIEEPSICAQHSGLFLITIVHSAPANYKRRLVIRETWGNQKYYSRVKNVVIFALGYPTPDNNNNISQRAIEMESDRYHDLIQGNFTDSYRNLTYKVILWLKWVSSHCPQAIYLVKVDDDVLVNIFALASHLSRLYTDEIADRNSIICLTWEGMEVMRDMANKWYVAESDYVSSTFSRYCSGSAYIISRDLITQLFNKVSTTKFFWIDDFYATGLLPKDLKVYYHDIRALYVLDSTQLYAKLVEDYAVFGHAPDSLSEVYQIWSAIIKQRRIS